MARQLEGVFRRIGVPPKAPFRPDPFQLEALERLRSADVLVIAPTGSGKTWVAREAMRLYLEQGKRCWYASPLKALSNAKYAEFSAVFGDDNVGILTGDRQEKADAPLIVGTTEILRNQLYDAMTEGRDIGVDLAILDEAHYLSDPDRGVVWEEVLIYLPQRVRLLLLSATIGNGEEVSRWLEETRGVPCEVVQSKERPVPLQFLFLFPDGELTPLGTSKGVLPKIKKFLDSKERSRGRTSWNMPHFGLIIEHLRKVDLLPAIFFLKSRADCDRAVERSLPGPVQRRDDSDFGKDLQSFLSQYPFLEGHRQLPYLERFRVGSHHAGQLPQWKLLIEEMMNRGYLDAIFATSTVAAGVNFPARTVVLVQSDRFDGRRFSDLTATELQQMTGRAGRRGKDRIGFALVLPGLYQDPVLIHQLIDSPPEPLKSQIQMSFSMVLNLLLSHRPSEIEALLGKSFAAFQERETHPDLKREWSRLVPKLKALLPEGAIPEDDPIVFLKALRLQAGLKERVETIKREMGRQERAVLFSDHLKRGRLFLHKKGHFYVAFRTVCRRNRWYCMAYRLTRTVRGRRSDIRLRRIPVQAIEELFDYSIDIPEDTSKEALSTILASIPIDAVQPLRLTSMTLSAQQEELRKAEAQLADLPDFSFLRQGTRISRNGQALWMRLQRLILQTDRVRDHLWNEFKRHLDFLKETGFVDSEDRLTEDGRWASCLRLDHPLLIAEAIRKGLFEDAPPPTLAALMAPFVVDKTKEIAVPESGSRQIEDLKDRFDEMVRRLAPLQQLKRLRGFETLQIQFWPAVLLAAWANGVPWEGLTRLLPLEEGDMAMLILRTADHVRQLLDLSRTHPLLAGAARQALPLILREPVIAS